MELEKERQEILEKGLYFRLNLTGFLEKKTPEFMKELWGLLLEA